MEVKPLTERHYSNIESELLNHTGHPAPSQHCRKLVELEREGNMSGTGTEQLAKERGQRMRTARKSLGLTLETVSSDIGISRATLWKWEAGETAEFSAVPLLRLARRLYTSVEWLLWGEEADPWIAEHRYFFHRKSSPKGRRT